MHEINPTTSTEINRLHQLATKTAGEAVEYAKRIGELLLIEKSQMPYGQFVKWMEETLTVSPRQAQRYMAVAQGKPIPVRKFAARNDTVSHLTEQQLSMLPDDIRYGNHPEDYVNTAIEYYCPTWMPKAGHKHVCVTNEGAYWVVSDIKNPNKFHISHLYGSEETDLLGNGESDGGLCECTRWAELPEHVEFRLKHFGLTNPSTAKWKVFKSKGSVAPFGAPETAGKIKVLDKYGNEKWIQDAF